MTVAKKVIILLLIVLALPSLWAQNRYALVIGNANYNDPTITPLPNTLNDAEDISRALREIGYQVVAK